MWAYAVKMAGLRVPMMGAREESSSPWEKLANSIQNTMALAQREMVMVQEINGTQSFTARETIIEPSAEQKRIAGEIVQNMIRQAQEGNS